MSLLICNLITIMIVLYLFLLPGEWRCVLQIFQQGSPELRSKTQNLAVAACEEGSCWQRALKILEEAVAGDVYTYSSVVGACARAAQWQAALATFHAMMGVAVQPNTVTCNSLMDALASSSGQWQRAFELLSMLPLFEVQADEITWTSAIRACETCNEWVLSLAVLDRMPLLRIMPNIVSYGSAVRACRWSDAWPLALVLVERMLAQSIEADLLFSNTLLSLLAKAEQWLLATDLLASMVSEKMEPDETTWATVADVGKDAEPETPFHS
ncbi:unnamed protein product [Symbiodinium natans]|uniref:Pentatricopeptide repeat-containing protein, chloroplastic n=1 Tax=Symbiodinium natans TaxID=878477 RepID=A0A812V4Y1_9DINO|nr:unnamed protein product [Symbiodinium natans]